MTEKQEYEAIISKLQEAEGLANEFGLWGTADKIRKLTDEVTATCQVRTEEHNS